MLIATLPLFNNCYLASYWEIEDITEILQVIECYGPLGFSYYFWSGISKHSKVIWGKAKLKGREFFHQLYQSDFLLACSAVSEVSWSLVVALQSFDRKWLYTDWQGHFDLTDQSEKQKSMNILKCSVLVQRHGLKRLPGLTSFKAVWNCTKKKLGPLCQNSTTESNVKVITGFERKLYMVCQFYIAKH